MTNCLNSDKTRPVPLREPVAIDGGGGNRTRVPRHFRAGIYVCSPIMLVAYPAAATRLLPKTPTGGVPRLLSARFFSKGGRRIEPVARPSSLRDPDLRPNDPLSGEGDRLAHGYYAARENCGSAVVV